MPDRTSQRPRLRPGQQPAHVLRRTRRVIGCERQGYGRTADTDRPFTLDQWADDPAALLRHLDIEKADVLKRGYRSMSGNNEDRKEAAS